VSPTGTYRAPATSGSPAHTGVSPFRGVPAWLPQDSPRTIGSVGGVWVGAHQAARVRGDLSALRAGGRVSLLEWHAGPRAGGIPVHLHERTEEAFYVLRGQIALWLEGEEVVRDAGSYTVVAPGQRHTFWNPTDEPAAYLTPLAPAGFEEYLRELALGLDAPPPRRKRPPCAGGSPTGTTSRSSRRRRVSEERSDRRRAPMHRAAASAAPMSRSW
jgi:mannose-6-phosphate isomerase-like protein (cupin superfamily)